MNERSLAAILERLGTLLRVEARARLADSGLQPVHLEVLGYLGSCNRYSDTLLAVTEYLGQTKGTVSQSLKLLESKGLISRTADKKDRRLSHLALTPAGRKLLHKASPQAMLEQATDQPAILTLALTELLGKLQKQHQHKTFGVCRNCRFHQAAEKGGLCGLTGEKLSARDAGLICREHEPAEPA